MKKPAMMRRAEAGAELRALREARGMGLREMSHIFGENPGLLSKWERGLYSIAPWQVGIYFGACSAPLPEARRVAEMLQPPNDLYWVRPYFDKLTDPVKSLIIQENLASAMFCYDPDYVPGLHQTEDYARAMQEDQPHLTAEKIDLIVNSRLDRQRLLREPDSPCCAFFIHERALRTIVGNAQIMHEQLQYLMLSTSLSHCSIRVVPEATPAGRARRSPFRVMEFPEPRPAMAYAEVDAANLFIEDRPAVEAYYCLVTQLEQCALNEGQSRDWLIRLADEYERMRE
ncbi:Scr1 family TA system antitoxin-like transcriptional regulator [Amycolatopsis sp. NPDC059027]|uniref:helix-turn-helix domain-containing protein n=1 Tax=Amycolatopsis sp. NPDC059027 TaxID=3346709 RepID=UPI003672201F